MLIIPWQNDKKIQRQVYLHRQTFLQYFNLIKATFIHTPCSLIEIHLKGKAIDQAVVIVLSACNDGGSYLHVCEFVA